MTTPTPPPAAPDPQLIALGRAVERTARRVADLDVLLGQLAADVTTLARTRTPAPGSGSADADADDGPGVRAWLLATDPDQARDDLTDLIEWLDRVFLRYHGATLSSCWLWHPDVVEELWWLRCAHAEAYHPENGSWLRAGDWHDRQRPGVVKRINTVLGSCELSLHTPGQLHARPPAVAPLASHADDVAAAWTTSPGGTRPEPSPAQLAEADAHNRDQHRSRSYR